MPAPRLRRQSCSPPASARRPVHSPEAVTPAGPGKTPGGGLLEGAAKDSPCQHARRSGKNTRRRASRHQPTRPPEMPGSTPGGGLLAGDAATRTRSAARTRQPEPLRSSAPVARSLQRLLRRQVASQDAGLPPRCQPGDRPTARSTPPPQDAASAPRLPPRPLSACPAQPAPARLRRRLAAAAAARQLRRSDSQRPPRPQAGRQRRGAGSTPARPRRRRPRRTAKTPADRSSFPYSFQSFF